jgi:hypothetical protein
MDIKAGAENFFPFDLSNAQAQPPGALPVDPAVTGITVSAPGGTVILGGTLQFTASVAAQGGASQALSWSLAAQSPATLAGGTNISAAGGLLTVDATQALGDVLIVTATSDFDPSRSDTKSVTVSSFGVSLNPPASYPFPSQPFGYAAAPAALTLTISNTGTQPTGPLTLALSGTNPGAFSINSGTAGTGGSASSIAVSGTGVFTVQPVTGLAVGSYSATVTVSGGNGISANMTVSFAVDPVYTYNTPTHAAVNGVTPSVSYSVASPQTAGTSVTATVSFTGIATNAGTFSVDLTSGTISVTGGAQTFNVTAGQNSGFGTTTFSFTVPSSSVTDLALPFSFTQTYSLSTAYMTGQSSAWGTLSHSTPTSNPPGNVTVTATPQAGYYFVKWVATNSLSDAELSTNTSHNFSISGNTTVYAVFGTEITSSSIGLITTGGYYKLTGNITLTSEISVTASGVNLDGGGYTITRGSSSGAFFTVGGSGSLTLSNITLNGNKGSYTATDALVKVYGTFTLGSGATLQNNKNPSNDGGGVLVNGGTFIMNGGTISGNEAYGGGGVAVAAGTFSMTGGSITGNTASNDGGGVTIYNGGSLTMSDGTITNNDPGASNYGGGVCMASGTTLTINSPATGGTSGNISGNINGNVYNYGGTINGSASPPSGIW